MAVLNSWQKLTRVLPGMPFGDGIDGDYSSSTIPTITYRSCSGSSGSTTLTLGSSGFSNGDIILIHQTRGTGAGQWEINRIVSGGGTTSLTLQHALYYTYTDSGASQAQAVKIPRYNNVTCSGTWTVTSWNGDTGGIFAIAARKIATIQQPISCNGGVGGNPSGGSGCGFGGGAGVKNTTTAAYCGEGTNGASTNTTNSNGNGGGGGKANSTGGNLGGGGGGGGNGETGQTGQVAPSGGVGGAGGSTSGSNDLISITFGGGGGGGADGYNEPGGVGGGGAGGGIVMIIANELNISSSGGIAANGGNGGVSGAQRGGGGGAGGSILLAVNIANLGTNKITASKGIGGQATTKGGDGGAGRIAVHYSGSISGSTNPTYYGQYDQSLIESFGGSFLFNFV